MTSRIHEGLVGERRLVGTPYLADQELRRQYAEQIAPRTEAALARIFADFGARAPTVRRVVDLGAGTGAAGRAARACFGEAIEVVSVDRVAAPGIDVVADLRKPGRPAAGTFDLVLAAHVLNELGLSLDAQADRVRAWCGDLLAPNGLCVVVEPALRETSRALLGVRDRLIAAGLFVLAPCLGQAPCPALVKERDFCHASADWPEQHRGRSRVDYSYLVLAAQGAPTHDDHLYRIVSDPLVDKGRSRLWGCGPAGRHTLVRLKRDRSESNRGFDDLGRGDVVAVQGGSKSAEGLRVGAGAVVSKQR